MKVLRSLLALTFALCLLAASVSFAYAQAGMGEMDNGIAAPPATQAPEPNDVPPPVASIPMRQPVSGTMMVSPPYGNAPLRVGFFVLANDPENIGFLTYQWNFGDGTVSALPPEMYIFHSYPNPGNYVCTLIAKTVDGRSITLMQGVLVKPRQD